VLLTTQYLDEAEQLAGRIAILAVESDPRAERMLDLMRERGWASWTRTRPERLAEPPD
jgi:ABC-type multidrug transport system ATPase subunit